MVRCVNVRAGSVSFLLAGALISAANVRGAEPSPAPRLKREAAIAIPSAECEGFYTNHLQGICTDGGEAIFWSWTDVLVKTDRRGRLLKQVRVSNHHGDLCFLEGRVTAT